MRRRLFFLLPDVESARQTANDLLLARVEDRHMSFLAKRGTDLGELHEASYLQKTDLVHGAGVGLMIGALGGVLLGLAIVVFPPVEGSSPPVGVVLITTLIGAVLGAFFASMAAAAVPNSRLKPFHEDIARGKVLLMLDVPYDRVEEVRDLVLAKHPEAVAGGQDSRFPAFP